MAENGENQLSGAKPSLFAQVNFHIVLSEKLGSKEADDISRTISEYGGVEKARTSTSGDIELTETSHIISKTSDFAKYSEAEDNANLAIVTPSWVHESIRRSRLANVRSFTPDPKKFFSGLLVSCADLPDGDKDAIYAGVLQCGGQTSSPVTKLVTHIVALSTNADKCKTAIAKNLNCKIVLPHWFDDCLKLGQRIDEDPYLLPDPEILREKRGPSNIFVREVKSDHLIGAATNQPAQLPTPINSPNDDKTRAPVFRNKRITLSKDLGISSHLTMTLENLVIAADGTVTASIHEADILICQFRDEGDYTTAYKNGLEIGNLAWLYYLITSGCWTSPLRRLLHYPVVREGLPDFKRFRICLSNYSGDARVYLENLAKAIGSEFTKTMTQENTHLITAHTVSEKCTAAKEWGIHVVNHLWLEESYAKWQVQSLTNPRYVHFPARTNLSQVVGQTPIDKEALERSSNKGILGHRTLGPAIEARRFSAKLPTSSGHGPAPSSPVPSAEPLRPLGSGAATPQASKERRRHNDDNGFKTPAGRALHGKENETPSSTGSRKAKDVATSKLHDAAHDMNQYAKEAKRPGGVTHGGRRSTDEVVQDPKPSKKRPKSVDDESGTYVAGKGQILKKVKKSKGLDTIRLMVSGYERWNPGKEKQVDIDRVKLKKMKIEIESQSAQCTHVAVPNIRRTQKLICAVAAGAMVVSTTFVDKCLESTERPDPQKFPLEDKVGEQRLACTMADARTRAVANSRKLLKGYHLFCTETPEGNFDIYKAICEANGGRCLLYKGRTSQSVALDPPRSEASDSETEGDDAIHRKGFVYLISTNEPEDKKIWPKFNAMVLKNNMTPRIVKNDWLTDGLLRQSITWEDAYEQEGSKAPLG